MRRLAASTIAGATLGGSLTLLSSLGLPGCESGTARRPNVILINADDLGYEGIRFGGTREPIELYDLRLDIGETENVAADHPEIVARVDSIMREARKDSPFTSFWPLPEYRQNQIKWDKRIFDQLEHGIR